MRPFSYAIAAAAAAAVVCGCDSRSTAPLEASAHVDATTRYDLATLTASLGGTRSRGDAINARGMVAGFSLETGDTSRHATLWTGNSVTDLNTLGGLNSAVIWPGLNDRGMVVGISHTARTDTLGESWSCGAFLPNPRDETCLGFFWERGVMTPMPTLGGDHGFATDVNNRAQVVGWAETTVIDPTCDPVDGDQVLQFHAVLWEPKRNRIRTLQPFPGDSASAATAINERGQAVGISGDCDIGAGRFSAKRAVLWEQGRVREIPNLGGEAWHTPMDINESGDVVGFSNPPGVVGGDLVPHGFLWSTSRPDTIIDIEPLPGDDNSTAFAVNARRQVVGSSCRGSVCRAFLWEDGALHALQLLVPAGSDSLVSARDINDAGQITGDLIERSTGKTRTFVATPRADTP